MIKWNEWLGKSENIPYYCVYLSCQFDLFTKISIIYKYTIFSIVLISDKWNRLIEICI